MRMANQVCRMNVKYLELPTALQCPDYCDIVCLVQVTARGQAARQARHPYA